MPSSRPSTLGELKASGHKSIPVRDELRKNLIAKLRSGDELFPGIVGYGDTVVPQLVNAVLARHDFILLGLRGQAKSRILRQLAELLDPELPILAGSEVNDDPMDVDPIKAARGGHILADELTIHFGLLPRANRGVFAINELPDLAGKIQVGLFNILQEGDVQIKGYPIRLPLDVFMVFTANPEDYTTRGKIITPLKDRIGGEIRTHYPLEVETGIAITRQEAWVDREGLPVHVPAFLEEVVERVAFLAREDKRIDQRSGISQRLPITLLENMVSSAERRAFLLGEPEVAPRIADLYAALPSITGKMELEYEGELHGAEKIARELISASAGITYGDRAGGADVEDIVAYFEEGGALQVSEDAATAACLEAFQVVPGLLELVEWVGLVPKSATAGLRVAACELVLEALVAERRISRSDGGYARPPFEA